MKKEINIQIGARIRHARQQLKLSREALAEILGISSLFVGYIECGQKGMSIETLCAMCNALHVSADYLLLGKSGESASSDEIQQLISLVDSEYYPLLQEHLRLFIKTITVVQANDAHSTAPAERSVSFAARGGGNATVTVTDQTAQALQKELARLTGQCPLTPDMPK